MPLYNRRPHMNEVLDTAVSHRFKLRDLRAELMHRSPTEWMGTCIATPLESIDPCNDEEASDNEAKPSNEFEPSPSLLGRYFIHVSKCVAELSRRCELALASRAFVYMRLIVAPLAFFNLAYLAPYQSHKYPSLDLAVFTMDNIVNAVFIAQAVLQVIGTPIRVQFDLYRRHDTSSIEIVTQSGVLALPITMMCFITGSESEQGLWFRLIRLFFITNTICDFIPQTHILISGMFNGLMSTSFSFLLLLNLVAMYASLGQSIFRTNDPFNFGSFSLALISLFRVATFDNWSNLYNINLDGCDATDSEYTGWKIYETFNVSSDVSTPFGSFRTPSCRTPQASPIAAGVLFWSFIIIGSFVLLSVSLAAIAIGIMTRLDELQSSAFIQNVCTENTRRRSEVLRAAGSQENEERRELMAELVKFIWTGQRRRSSDEVFSKDEEELGPFLKLANRLKGLVSAPSTRMAIVLMTLTGVLTEVFRDSQHTYPAIVRVKIAVQSVLTVDLVLRLLLHTPSLAHFFMSSWRIIDTATIILLWLPIFESRLEVLEFLYFLRMFLATTHFFYLEELASVAVAIMESAKPFGYVGFLMFIFFYFFGISGIMLFKEADPYHWRSVEAATNTLLQLMTLDGWYIVARVGMLGCANFGYFTGFAKYDSLCKENGGSGEGMGWWVPIHYIFFIIGSAYILLSLLVGMILSSLELLRQEILEKNQALKKAEVWIDVHDLVDEEVDKILQLFELLDFSMKGAVIFSDIYELFALLEFEEAKQFAFFRDRDLDGNGKLDFAEFCDFIGVLKVIQEPSWLRPQVPLEVENPNDIESVHGSIQGSVQGSLHGSVHSRPESIQSLVSLTHTSKQGSSGMTERRRLDTSPIELPEYMSGYMEDGKEVETNFAEEELFFNMDHNIVRRTSYSSKRMSI